MTGRRLAGAAAMSFLAPVASAIAGAIVLPILWSHEVSQLAGGAAGLGIGAGFAGLLAPGRGRR